MATPHISFRLPKKDQKALREMAKVYGAPSDSAFMREMVVAMCSGDVAKAQGFIARFFEKLTGQMTLELQAQALAEMKGPQKHPARRISGQVKRGRHERTP